MSKIYNVVTGSGSDWTIHSAWTIQDKAENVAALLNAGAEPEGGFDLPGQEPFKVTEVSVDVPLDEMDFATGYRGEFNYAWLGRSFDAQYVEFMEATFEDYGPREVFDTGTALVVIANTKEECINLLSQTLG